MEVYIDTIQVENIEVTDKSSPDRYYFVEGCSASFRVVVNGMVLNGHIDASKEIASALDQLKARIKAEIKNDSLTTTL